MRNQLKRGDDKRINKLNSNKKEKKKKSKYKIRNWREYNQALVDRYDFTLWVEKGIADVWREGNKIIIRKRKPGKPRLYSEAAIETLATVQELFHLTYRGIEGFGKALFQRILQFKVRIPDFSTINRRRKVLEVIIPAGKHQERKQKIDLVLDSSGLKVYGEGEWKVRQHGISKRRTWRKIHLGINPQTGEVEAVELTENGIDDAQMAASLINQVEKEIVHLGGDGAYDKWKVYETLMKRGIKGILIPPRHGAHLWEYSHTKGNQHPRDQNLRRIWQVGRDKWKEESGYHMRSLAETGVYRFKTIFSDRLSARDIKHQKVEVELKCKILNKMTSLGMPDSYKVDFSVK